jgi:phage-related tail protein
MDPNQAAQLISSVGFPIVACFIMWKSLQDSTAAHKEEMNAIRDSLNQNTVVLAELKTLMKEIADNMKESNHGNI